MYSKTPTNYYSIRHRFPSAKQVCAKPSTSRIILQIISVLINENPCQLQQFLDFDFSRWMVYATYNYLIWIVGISTIGCSDPLEWLCFFDFDLAFLVNFLFPYEILSYIFNLCNHSNFYLIFLFCEQSRN